ncbi:transketolase [Blochmannia endosymbiont of Camponotus sp. C-046]|uniref:transketolase n=1 Tax=Blochmannia endosymbiont of Camponotus sp. C-046 TaxID=2945589 RepID=UPI002024D637|nr:transketolase [Blochmannia endosymbiont of Camponotus sp. C-046]URJ28795.1 transketolase [Blochmannia endosymbiont of Camponotus sp. C-046]
MLSEKILANAIRILSIDAIQKANSGHPGCPMGMADIAEVLWRDYLNHNPNNPNWINRDRFVLSNGHGSMLLYSILHLTGYKISIEDLKNFRQLNSKTPGHPEYENTDGVEVTTGPLGQGLANAVGFAIAERTLAAQFNRAQFNIINHYTYVFVGDGCMMEGISHEVCALAGTMKLNKLIIFYDNNGISIDGNVQEWFTDNTAVRFEAYGWHVIRNINGHNRDSVKTAINQAQSTLDRPSLLICNTIIAFGSPNKSGTHSAHGAPLGVKEVVATRKALNWNEPPFVIPKEIYKLWNATILGQKKENNWQQLFYKYQVTYPNLAKELIRRIQRKLPDDWYKDTQQFIENLQVHSKNIATRQASQIIIESFSRKLPELFGGSADLTPSNLTACSQSCSIMQNPSGNYIHYGVREFGMTAIANGIANYGTFLPYTATFLTFSEYARNAVRMAALMNSHHIIIYTHDSIGLGEDGPTHQPVEQLSSLRMTPNLTVWRPCDQVETAVAWKLAIENRGPTVLILSRQNLTQQERTSIQISNIARGGYILKDCQNIPELIIIATGSEITLAVESYYRLTDEGYKIRVISLPSTDIFDQQDQSYREYVLPNSVINRIAIEASSADYWHKYVGLHGEIIGMNTFGKSAPSNQLFKFFDFTVDYVINKSYKLLKTS